MDLKKYQMLARRTQNQDLTPRDMLEHALYGLSSEVGEISGIFQKEKQGKPISLNDLKLEIGDVLWMLAELCDVYSFNLDDIAEKNIAKLRKRYPDGFDAERSNSRYGKNI